MTNEEIIKIAREAGFKVDWQHADVAEIKAQRFVAFAHAVIKAHEANLIAVVGEPAVIVTSREPTGLDVDEGLYTATQVAAAVAKFKASLMVMTGAEFASNAVKDAVVQKDKRIATLESTLKLALEALENGKRVRNFESGTAYQPPLEDAAIIQCEEVLHG